MERSSDFKPTYLLKGVLELNKIAEKYPSDTLYHHLKLIFNYLNFEILIQTKEYEKAWILYSKLSQKIIILLNNYSLYCFTSKILFSIIELYLVTGKKNEIHFEKNKLFENYHLDINNSILSINYYSFLLLVYHFEGKHKKAVETAQALLTQNKNSEFILLIHELQCFVLYQYLITGNFIEFYNYQKSENFTKISNKIVYRPYNQFLRILITIAKLTKKTNLIKIETLFEKIAFSRHFSILKLIVKDISCLNSIINKKK